MDIVFADRELEECANDAKRASRKLGRNRARRLRRRLDDLRAAPSLGFAVKNRIPGRVHPNDYYGENEFTIDLDGSYRLFFKPACEELPLKEDGGLNLEQITAIKILRIGDPHG